MSLQANFPNIRPTLLLDFANAKALDPRVTFTRASTATYFDNEGVLRTAASGEPRFAFDPDTEESLGLLIEEARTNLLTYSEQFDNAAWVLANAAVAINAVIAPDGTLTADKLASNSVSGFHSIAETVASKVASTPYTFSFYAKAGEIGFCFPNFSSGLTGNQIGALVNLTTGAVTSIGAGLTVSTTSVGNGWWRIAISATGAANTTGFTCTVNTTDASGTLSHTGDGASGIYIWGAQLEAGSFPTSYIPTVASAVTRAGDLAVMTGTNLSSWFNPNESTFYAEASTMSLPANIYHYICSLSLGTSTSAGDFLRMAFLYTSKVDFTVGNSNTFTTLNTTSTPSITVDVPRKSAIAVAAQDLVGVTASWTPSTSAARSRVALVDTLTIGSQAAVSSNRALNGTIKKLAYYPVRLTNAQLQALTA